MKKFFTIIAFAFFFTTIRAQDAGVTDITSPVSGCSLTSTETVTIRIFNYGSNITSPFDVSYQINGGAPVTESVFASAGSPILTNSTYTYSFTTPANLSTAGTYTINAYSSLTGDINPTNDAYSENVISTAPSVGGTITAPATVCETGNSGTLTLSGHTGAVQRWEYSTDLGATWVNISNTTTSQSYLNISDTTYYRVLVQNSPCPAVYSSVAIINIDLASVGGTLASNNSLCTGDPTVRTLTLTGKRGNVLYWQYSTNGGSTWTNIVNTTTTHTYSNLTTTTRYRVVVQNGTCAPANSNSVTITISPNSVGGTITPDSVTVCSGANSGTLTLSGHIGSVVRWQRSTDNGVTWTNIANTTTTQNYTNLTVSRWYRAQVRSGACAQVNSDTARIYVSPGSVGGTVNSSATVCSGNNSGTLTLTGETGSVVRWEFSTDGGSTWTDIANTTTTEAYLNITVNTMYRAFVQLGTCGGAYSSTATLTVNTPSVGGAVTGDATVCSGSNGGTLTLSGDTGAILNWISSTDGGATWTNIANTSASQTYTNLTATTIYAAVVQSGVCPADTSTPATITVDPITVGGSVSGAGTVCSGANSGAVTLMGSTGNVLQWEYSTDGGATWITIVNTTTSQSYNNITTATTYRALVQSGVCSQAYSSPATLAVDPQSVGGTVYGETTVCATSNSGTLTLIGYTGGIVGWESSVDAGVTWSPIANTSAFENYNNLAVTTHYRALVRSGVCFNDTSSVAIVYVDAASVGGAITMSDTVCAGANSDTLNLTGHTGSVMGWEISTDGGFTWYNISNTTTEQRYNNLMTTTMFRATVKNGVCPAANATEATLTVLPASVGGTLNGSTAVCDSSNSGNLNLTGYTGNITMWQYSTDYGTTWTDTIHTTANYTYTNLSDTTWFRAIVMNGFCANDTSTTALIETHPRPVVDFIPTVVCIGGPTTFTNQTTISSGFIQFYNWDFGNNQTSIGINPAHTYTSPGIYSASLVAISNFGCVDSIRKNVTVNGLPDATITPSSSLQFCVGDSVTLIAVADSNYAYLWNAGDSIQMIQPSITVDSSATYILTVTDTITGCVNSDSIVVIVNSTPIADAGMDSTISLGESIYLEGKGGLVYSWTPSTGLSNSNISNPLATPLIDTRYVLMVTDDKGCTDSDTVSIFVKPDYKFTVNNILTPNGDGFNDVWLIENIMNYPNNEVIIFNRNGQVVFQANDYKNDWEGTFNGSPLSDGTYYYVVKFTDSEIILKGSITVLTGK